MEPGHADPLQEALSQGAQRAAQLASLAGAWAQVAIHRRTLSDASTAADDDRVAQVLGRQEQLLREQSRTAWAPATDPDWLVTADLTQVGRAWAGAACDAESDPVAAASMRKCEDRLRRLHPYAMTFYDRLRADGTNPLQAMQETAPFFARPPSTRPGEPAAARQALTSIGSADADWPTSSPPEPDSPDPAAIRGMRIAERLQARTRAAGRPPLGADEMAMFLDAATNLPPRIIAAISSHAVGPNDGFGSAFGTSPAELAGESFPHTAAAAIQATASSDVASRSGAATRRPGLASTTAASVTSSVQEANLG